MKKGTDHPNAAKATFAEFMHATALLASGEVYRFEAPPLVFRQEDARAAATRPSIEEVATMLFQQVHDQVVSPLLAAATPEALDRALHEGVPIFAETMKTLRNVLEAGSSQEQVRKFLAKGERAATQTLIDCAQKFAGAAAADDVRFATRTYESAVMSVARIVAAGKPEDPAKAERSSELAQEFGAASLFHELGAVLVLALAAGHRGTPLAIDWAFDALRGGAINAYAAAREAEMLMRSVPAPEQGEVTLDEEDVALAELDD